MRVPPTAEGASPADLLICLQISVGCVRVLRPPSAKLGPSASLSHPYLISPERGGSLLGVTCRSLPPLPPPSVLSSRSISGPWAHQFPHGPPVLIPKTQDRSGCLEFSSV